MRDGSDGSGLEVQKEKIPKFFLIKFFKEFFYRAKVDDFFFIKHCNALLHKATKTLSNRRVILLVGVEYTKRYQSSYRLDHGIAHLKVMIENHLVVVPLYSTFMGLCRSL